MSAHSVNIAAMQSAAASAALDRRLAEIRDAALGVFSSYGYRRASMEEIARTAGLSRTALYNRFRDKEAVFRDMVENLHSQALAAADAAASRQGSPTDRVVAIVEAKQLFFFRLLHESRHGAELLSESHRLSGDLNVSSKRSYLETLAGVLTTADGEGDLDLEKASMSAGEAAELLYLAVEGLQGDADNPPSVATYRNRLRHLVATFVAGLAPPPSEQKGRS